MQFQTDLIDQVGIHRARGIVIDVAALDVLGSFASKSLHDLAYMAAIATRRDRHRRHPTRGGVRPRPTARPLEVHTALDLEEGLAHLELVTSGRRSGRATLEALDERNRNP